MQNNITIARPYVNAILELASADDSYEKWSEMLEYLSLVSQDSIAARLIDNLSVSHSDKAQFICSLNPEVLTSHGENLVKVLAQAKRLGVLQEIYKLYSSRLRALKNEVEMKITVATKTPQSEIDMFGKVVPGTVDITEVVDANLLGGGIAQLGNRIVDGSIRARLMSLKEFIVGD